MASLSDSAPWDVDPGCIPIPWRRELASKPEEGKKLKLGIVYDDGVVRPQPPVARAMREVAKKLVDAGHEGSYLSNPIIIIIIIICVLNESSNRMGHNPP